MRLLVSTASVFLLAAAWGQEQTPEAKHLIVTPANGRAIAVTALSIERGVEYPSVLTLKGNVEIKTPVCVPVGKKGKPVCDGKMIVRADEATLNEGTGAIEAQGKVTVTPLQHER